MVDSLAGEARCRRQREIGCFKAECSAQVYARNGPERELTVQLDSPLHTESTVTQAGSHEGLHAAQGNQETSVKSMQHYTHIPLVQHLSHLQSLDLSI